MHGFCRLPVGVLRPQATGHGHMAVYTFIITSFVPACAAPYALTAVEEVGPEVKLLKRGNRVAVASNISCGECYYCRTQLFIYCDRCGGQQVLLRLVLVTTAPHCFICCDKCGSHTQTECCCCSL